MAAKPPKPPGNFLKSLLNQHNNNKNQTSKQQNNENDNIKESGNSYKQHLTTTAPTTTTESTISIINPAYCNTTTTTTATTAIEATKKENCNCSNISIMHLFHEMKQEFPTIPDTIVAQCVNENCHQREHCIQMLKNELELNPVPAQSYPAKVLHPPNNTNYNSNSHNILQNSTATAGSTQKPPLQHKPQLLVVQQKPPLKPIRPIRTAPLQPPTNQNQQQTKQNSTQNKNTVATATKPLVGEDLGKYDDVNVVVEGGGAGGVVESKINSQYKQSISNTSANNVNSISTLEACNDDKIRFSGGGESCERSLPRQRPTTLNLNTQLLKQQQQQRQRLNIQLQQRFQEQRSRHQQQQPQSQIPTTLTKPIRKAPLPPIAPKPSQFQLNHINTNSINSNSNDILLTNHNHIPATASSPPSESEISVSVSLSTPSPSPSCTSSLSPNTTTHHQTFNKPTQQPSTTNQQHLQTKSPIRHRSVITLQPEPPYTRDFLFTPASLTYASSIPTSVSPVAPSTPTGTATTTKQTTATNSSSSATSSPTGSVASSQKSFTSVNLTLRPPISPNDPNSALQPATIDITAGPGFSGASGGGKSLHYSSTSYDARLGYQQNFQITVTDECGIFSASRIRPQQQQQHPHPYQRYLNQVNINEENQYDNNSHKVLITNHKNYVNSFLNAKRKQQQQFHNNNVVALQQNIQNSIQSPQDSGGGSSGITEYTSGSMCLSPQQQQAMDAHNQETLQRQKNKRDKLAGALREYKKRLCNVEQEINLLTGTIPTEGLSERLDEEIKKLRRDCQDMLRSSNAFSQAPSQQELAINYQPQQIYQQESQPFPRSRITRPPPRPPPPHQTSLDIIQHHSQASTPHTPPAVSLPNLNVYHSTSALYYDQQSEPMNANFSNNNNDLFFRHHHRNFSHERDLVEDDGSVYDMDKSWECSMCTFRNHPELNICETCENVRIIPGTLMNFSRSLTAKNYTNIAAAVAKSESGLGSSSGSATTSIVSPALDLLKDADSNNAINNSNSSTSTSSSKHELNNANDNLEHDLAQPQLQHFALHT